MFRCISKHPPPPQFRSLLRQPANLLRYFHQALPLCAAAKRAHALQPPKNGDSISSKIYEAFGGKQSLQKKRGDVSRINIVSSKLCDDVIERLAPTLEKHKGCDIIDINPGPCLWSSKLHNYLKPRTHLLVEPDTPVYEQFYKPLLDEQESTYKLIPEHGILWTTLHSLEKHLPKQEVLIHGDPRQNVPNNTLLFTANLGHLAPKIYGFKSMSQLFTHQMMSACRNHTVFQQYGLVRMLLWMHDPEKVILTPRTISLRTKFTVETELNFESIVAVASTDVESAGRQQRREHHLELERATQVVEKMNKNGITVPDGRAGSLHLEAIEKHGKPITDPSVDNIRKPFLIELEELEARFKRGEFSKTPATSSNSKLRSDYEKMKNLQHRRTYYQKEYMWFDEQLAFHDSIIAKEENLKYLPAEEAEKAKEEVKKLWEGFLDQMERRHYNNQAQFYYRLDDRRAFYNSPPILNWDRRPFEPLKVSADEFYPTSEMALLDLQPRIVEPILQDDVTYDNFEYIISTMLAFPTQSIEAGLISLAPGAIDWILPRCPSLTDISKGGYTNLKMMRVRILTRGQWKEILTAWMSWPFRPSDAQIMHRLGSNNEHDDDISITGDANRTFP